MSLATVNAQRPVNWRHPLNKSLVRYWKLIPQWTGGSTLRDLAGVEHGILNSMDASDWVHTADGPALDLDGSNDHVSLPHSQNIGETAGGFCIHVSVTSLPGSTGYILSHRTGGSGNRIYLTVDSSANLKATFDSSAIAQIGVLTVGKRHQIVMTWSNNASSQCQVYLDDANPVSVTGNFPSSAWNDHFTIGAFNQAWPTPSPIQFTAMRLYSLSSFDSRLSDNDVQQLYSDSKRIASATLNYHNPVWGWAELVAGGATTQDYYYRQQMAVIA